MTQAPAEWLGDTEGKPAPAPTNAEPTDPPEGGGGTYVDFDTLLEHCAGGTAAAEVAAFAARGEAVPEDGYKGDYVPELAERLPDAATVAPVELGLAAVAVMLERMRESLAALRAKAALASESADVRKASGLRKISLPRLERRLAELRALGRDPDDHPDGRFDALAGAVPNAELNEFFNEDAKGR